MALARKLTKKIYEIKAHTGKVTSLDLGETGRVLVTGGHDRNVNLWAIGEEKCFMSLTGHNGSIDCVKFAYNDDFVYSADDIGIIRRWDLNAQTICSTLNGHMESVRTLDFNPSGEYVVSGSNDTTVRLWDVRNQNKCIKIYRGHIAHVNSVKFSPDGLWIASAGTEGSVILWDIRKSKLLMEFTEKEPAVTCIQFHPFEFLLAAGRIDGTVSIYDLESKIRISKTDTPSPFSGYPIKCITFSENGECLFVGTSVGISVIGWEPDREFDHIESTWSAMGDMKIVNKKLFCGSYEQDYVAIHALSIDRVIPFYNPSNAPFSHNQTTRKSFSRGHQKLRLSIGGPKNNQHNLLLEENEERSPSLDGQSSPNLSLELVDEMDETQSIPNSNGFSVHFDFNGPVQKVNNPYIFPQSLSSETASYSSGGYDGPSSLKMPGERDVYKFNRIVDTHANEIEYNLNDSNPPIISNYDGSELVEDFPVNNAQQPDYASKSNGPMSMNYSSNNVQKTSKTKTTSHIQKRTSQIAISSKSSGFQSRSKLSNVSSVSTTDLHKIDDNMVMKKSTSSTISSKAKRDSNLNKENAKNKNITVQIITKGPTRSKTSLDLRSPTSTGQTQKQSHRISSYTTDLNNSQSSMNIVTTNNHTTNYRPDPQLITQPPGQRMHNNRMDDSSEIQMLAASHEQVYQELTNRHAFLKLIRNSTMSHDIVGALKQAIKMNGRTVFVDLLGAILEKTSSWNLDLCLLLLPEIYELLQSQHKFHYTRACDTLRVILSNFLPIIQDNIDPWSASGLGVDVTREERTRKCIECQHWLQRIRNISEPQHIGSTLTQLQNMIVDI